MGNIEEFTKAGGKFLKAEEVINSPDKAFIIHGPCELIIDEKYGSERLHIEGSFEGNEKTFNASRTNARTISDTLGPETDTWVGTVLTLETYKSKLADGKLVNVINVLKVKPAQAPAAAQTTVTEAA